MPYYDWFLHTFVKEITLFRTHGLLLFSEVQGEAMEPYCVSFDEVNSFWIIQWQQCMNSILGGKELVYTIGYWNSEGWCFRIMFLCFKENYNLKGSDKIPLKVEQF